MRGVEYALAAEEKKAVSASGLGASGSACERLFVPIHQADLYLAMQKRLFGGKK